MAEHDLTKQLSGYLDSHMTLARLDNALEKVCVCVCVCVRWR